MSTLRHALLRILRIVCIALFAILVLVVVWQVFTRQVLNSPSQWTTIAAQYMFVWLTLFAMTLVFGERGHIAVDVFSRLFPPKVQTVLAVLVQLSIVAFAALILVWGGVRGASMSWSQVVPSFALTVGQSYVAMPIAGVLIALFALADTGRILQGKDIEPVATDEDVADQGELLDQAAAADASATGLGSGIGRGPGTGNDTTGGKNPTSTTKGA